MCRRAAQPVSALDAPGRCDRGDVWADPIRPDLVEGEAVATIGQIFRKGFTCGDPAAGALHPDELTSETTRSGDDAERAMRRSRTIELGPATMQSARDEEEPDD